MNMSRVERKKQILRVLSNWDKNNKGHSMNTGMIAHRIGLKSSTHLVNIIRELVKDGWVQELSTAPNRYGQTFRAWRIARYEQQPLPDHAIEINGKRFWLSSGMEV